MGTPAKGAVVLVPFPFSDLSDAKRRPAVVLAGAGQGDWVLCQITSKAYSDAGAVPLAAMDFARGSLHIASYARPAKLFTAHESLIVAEVGVLHAKSLKMITDAVIVLIERGV